MIISNLLNKAVRFYPENISIVCGEKRFSYRDTYERVGKLAFLLRSLGVEKGDRIAIAHRNCHHYYEAYFAASFLGAILCSINIRLTPKEINFILNDSESKILIADREIKPIIEEACTGTSVKEVLWTGDLDGEIETIEELQEPIDIDPESPAHLYYTSGTTGRPKGVILTHKNVIFHSLMTIAELSINEKDVWLHAAPMFHLADAWATFAITWVGGRHVMVGKFQPEYVLELFEREKITITNMVPTMYNMLVNSPKAKDFDYSSIRILLSGGAPMPPELAKKVMDIFKCEYIQTYGLTETSPYLTLSKPKKDMPPDREFEVRTKTGREIMGVMLKVVRENGEEVSWNGKEVGEIIAKGPTITPGYWRLPEETEKAFKDGWFYTGDLATIDPDGYINIVDRKKDMIITGGENVYSTEVENVIYQHPAVYEVAVIGVPDEKWGEAVKAIVVLKEGERATEEDIIQFCKKHLAGYKVPKSVDFVKELPKTGSGKIAKRLLRELYTKKNS